MPLRMMVAIALMVSAGGAAQRAADHDLSQHRQGRGHDAFSAKYGLKATGQKVSASSQIAGGVVRPESEERNVMNTNGRGARRPLWRTGP